MPRKTTRKTATEIRPHPPQSPQKNHGDFASKGLYNTTMLQRVITVRRLEDSADQKREDIEYWLSRPPGERMAEMERLRRHFYGNLPRLQRVIRVLQREEG